MKKYDVWDSGKNWILDEKLTENIHGGGGRWANPGGGVRYARTLVRIVRGRYLTRLAAVQLDCRGGSEG